MAFTKGTPVLTLLYSCIQPHLNIGRHPGIIVLGDYVRQQASLS